MLADKLLFDIKTLNISSFEDGIIDTNVNLNEKGFRILKFKKTTYF